METILGKSSHILHCFPEEYLVFKAGIFRQFFVWLFEGSGQVVQQIFCEILKSFRKNRAEADHACYLEQVELIHHICLFVEWYLIQNRGYAFVQFELMVCQIYGGNSSDNFANRSELLTILVYLSDDFFRSLCTFEVKSWVIDLRQGQKLLLIQTTIVIVNSFLEKLPVFGLLEVEDILHHEWLIEILLYFDFFPHNVFNMR